MSDPKFVVHTTTVIHKEYIVSARRQADIREEWISLLPPIQEGVVCEKITHIKSINDYEYHNEYNGGIKPMNDPVEGSRYEIERGKEDE